MVTTTNCSLEFARIRYLLVYITQPNLTFLRTLTELEPYVYKLNNNSNRTEPW